MGWAKIVIEFQPERHDPNDVLVFLAEHFSNDDGVPNATITFAGVAPDDPVPGYCTKCGRPIHVGPCTPVYQAPSATRTGHGVTLPYSPTPVDLARAADQLFAFYPMQKIMAIKEMRILAGIGLKEAKDLIDDASMRAVRRGGSVP